MTYMTVDERSNDKLVLKRSPGLYAVAVAIVVVSLQSVENVTIEETVLKYVKQKVRVVVLTSNEGHKYYVTGSGTTDPISDHKAMCQEIRSFLNLQDEKEDCSN